jgi:hypothetical protein
MHASPSEVGMERHLKVVLLDADGTAQEGFGLQGIFVVPKATQAGVRIQMETIIRLVGTVFPHEGDYSFSILLNEDEKASIPVTVGPPPQAGG